MAVITQMCSVLVFSHPSCQPRHAMQLCDNNNSNLLKSVQAQVALSYLL